MNKPRSYQADDPLNILNQMDLSFEEACAALEEAGVNDPKRLSTFEFNQRVEYYRKKAQKNKAV